MTFNEEILNRWDDYFIVRGEENQSFWDEYLNEGEHRILYVLGAGFDSRMCMGPAAIINDTSKGIRDIFLIHINDQSNLGTADNINDRDSNISYLKILHSGRGNWHDRSIDMWPTDGNLKKRIGPRKAGEIFTNNSILRNYTDIILDISALPRLIYYPILTSLIEEHKRLKEDGQIINIYVVVAEDTKFDENIEQIGLDETAEAIFGFSATLSQTSYDSLPRVWLPVLGEGRSIHLERIHQTIVPDEIDPLIPWPSTDPRRGDRLLMDYHSLLFEAFESDPSNVIFAPESNPFAVYRAIKTVSVQYNKSFKALGGCITVISSLSSKLLSVGALLAAYSLKKAGYLIAIVQLDGKSYRIIDDSIKPKAELFSLWITGDCYEKE